MRAGLLRFRVAVDEPVETQDATGDSVVAWVTRATVWASIDPLKSSEALVAAQASVSTDTRITMRWTPTIDALSEKWRLRYQSTIYNVVSLANTGLRNREIVCLCKSGRDTG